MKRERKRGRIMKEVKEGFWKMAVGRTVRSAVRSVGIEYSVIAMGCEYGIAVLG